MLLNICCCVYYCCLTLTRWWNLFTHKWWMFNCSTSFFCRNTLTKSMIFKTQISISYLYTILFRHASNPEKSLSKFTSTIKVLQKCKEVHSIIYHGLHYWFLKLIFLDWNIHIQNYIHVITDNIIFCLLKISI